MAASRSPISSDRANAARCSLTFISRAEPGALVFGVGWVLAYGAANEGRSMPAPAPHLPPRNADGEARMRARMAQLGVMQAEVGGQSVQRDQWIALAMVGLKRVQRHGRQKSVHPTQGNGGPAAGNSKGDARH